MTFDDACAPSSDLVHNGIRHWGFDKNVARYSEYEGGRKSGVVSISSMGLAIRPFRSGRLVGVAANQGSGLEGVDCTPKKDPPTKLEQ